MKKQKNKSSSTKKSVVGNKVNKFIPPSDNKRLVLHVGCESAQKGHQLNEQYKANEWTEVRLTFDTNVKADIVSDPEKFLEIDDNIFDAVWIPHKIDRLTFQQVLRMFQECLRVLKVGASIGLSTPNLKATAEMLYKNGMNNSIYSAGGGEITPADVIFGFQKEINKGNDFALHRSGYTPMSLLSLLKQSGFHDCVVQRNGYVLYGAATKLLEAKLDNVQGKVLNDDVNEHMKTRDKLDKEPELPVNY